MSSFLRELAEATGIPHYAVPGAFQSKDGCVIGYKRGCLVEVGVGRSDLTKEVYVVFRLRSFDPGVGNHSRWIVGSRRLDCELRLCPPA